MDGVQPIVHQPVTPAVTRAGSRPERERRRAFERQLEGEGAGDDRPADAVPTPRAAVRRRPPPAAAGEGHVDLLV